MGGHDRFRAQHVQPAGKRTPRKVDRPPRLWLGGRSREPAPRRVAPIPMVSLVGVAVRHLLDWSLQQSNKGWAWGGARRGSFPAGLGSWVQPLWTEAGARGRVDTGRGSLAPSAASPGSCTPLAVFQPAGFQRGAEPGVRCAWSHGGPRCFRSRGKHCRGASPCLYCKEQPLRPVRVGPWEKSGLVTVVTRDDHGGIVGSRSAWTGWKSSSS